MINRNLHIFVVSGVIVYPHFVAFRIPGTVNNFVGVLSFISILLLSLLSIAVLYYCTAETFNATEVYTKAIKYDKPSLLNDNCLTSNCIIGRGSKANSQGFGGFLNSNQSKLQKEKRLILLYIMICRERVVMPKFNY